MEIKKPAMAGTLESSDCQVTVEPGNGSVEFNLESAVINQYGNQIRKEPFDGKAMGITPKGELIVDTWESRKLVSSGEVSVRGIYGYFN